jgi:hypothetical protein
MNESYSLERHLTVAVRNAVIALPVAFVLGALSGWALSRIESAPLGAILGTLIALGFLVWLCRMFHVTRGLLHIVERAGR